MSTSLSRHKLLLVATIIGVASILYPLLLPWLVSRHRLSSVMSDRQVLPTVVHPLHYTLTLTPDLVNFTFTGHVDINIEVKEQTNVISLNAHELQVQSARLTSIVGKAKQTLVTSSIDFDKEKHILTLTFPEVLPVKSTGTLSIDFTGILNDEMCGFYRSSYEDKDGNKKYMAVTQFESTDARRSFPCWDEPAIKATFDVTLNVPRELTALSNMNVVSTTDVEIEGKSLKSVVFAKTPLMSTYLLAFAVGEFDYIEAKSSGEKNGQSVLCRVYTPPGKTEEGEFALSITTQIIEYFADIFGQPYPLPKMDLLAVPDFEAGAMENWGLVTFRNVLLLWNKQSSSVRAKLNVATVVAHELAHQWFGNLVTMDWWSDLWLNEGFATWVGWLAVDHLFPEWEVWNQFVDEVVQSGLNLDSLRSSHPIEVPVKDAAEIPQIFDNISYNKGGSVIRMLSNYMGRDVFLAGIRRYLKKHAFANASTNDLWAALSEESGMDISEFMTLWTRYIGYPIITVKEVDEKSFTARQNRFLSSGDVKEEEDKHLWWVPLALATEAGKVDPEDKNAYVLTTREATFEKPAHETFYKLNRRLTGVYRVHYAKEHLANLAAAIRKGAMTETTDRISILSDAGALAACGAGSTADVLALLDSFENEEEFLVWREVSTRIHDISTIWFEQPEAERAALDRMSARLFGKQVDRLGWESKPDESFLTTQLRTLAISRAGNTNHQGVIDEAHKRFQRFMAGDESALHPDIRGAVFGIVVKTGTDANFESVFKFYRESSVADQKLMALSALGSTTNVAAIERLLEMTVTEKDIRPQDIIYVYRALSLNTVSRRPFWQFVKTNYDKLAERHRSSPQILMAIIKSSASTFASQKDADDIKAFFDARDHRNVARSVQQSLEKVQSNAAWLERAKNEVSAWLTKHVQS